MIEHCLFFKLKVTEEEEAYIMQLFKELPSKLKVIKELSFGKTFTTGRNGGYTHGLRVLFEKTSDLDVYGPNEDHQIIATWLKAHADAPAICLDWQQ